MHVVFEIKDCRADNVSDPGIPIHKTWTRKIIFMGHYLAKSEPVSGFGGGETIRAAGNKNIGGWNQHCFFGTFSSWYSLMREGKLRPELKLRSAARLGGSMTPSRAPRRRAPRRRVPGGGPRRWRPAEARRSGTRSAPGNRFLVIG